MVGVPEMVPVAGAMDRPAGRPVADHEVMVALDESVAVLVTGVMDVPEISDWALGTATATAPVTVHVKLAAPMAPELSMAVRVTGKARRATRD